METEAKPETKPEEFRYCSRMITQPDGSEKVCYCKITSANIWGWCAECLKRLPFWP